VTQITLRSVILRAKSKFTKVILIPVIVAFNSPNPLECILLGHDLSSQITKLLMLIAELRQAKTTEDYYQLSVELPRFALLPWLTKQSLLPQIYWHGRDNQETVACLGICRKTTADVPKLDTLPNNMRYYGGLGFDANAPAWSDFGHCHFILPRLELRHDSHKIKLLVNFCFLGKNKDDEYDDAVHLLTKLVWHSMPSSDENSTSQPQLFNREDKPNVSTWQQLVTQITEQNATGSLTKVVLSRRSQFQTGSQIDAWQLLQLWQQINPNCFQFGFKFTHKSHFISCSPERLYLRKGSQLTTEALAGTCLRSEALDTDNNLAQQLLKDNKNTHEHALVSQHILNALAPLTSKICTDDSAHIFKQNHIQHLRLNICAKLLEDVKDHQLLKALHPTPAVGGIPSLDALAFIRDNEGYTRGWYAGACGYLGRDESEFSVAIRCALIEEHALSLFSGAGIVTGSVPETEWQELDSKIETVLSILMPDPKKNTNIKAEL
jgi:menaquinone-specific isochorismate synthase